MDDDQLLKYVRTHVAVTLEKEMMRLEILRALSQHDAARVEVCIRAWVERILDGQYDDDILLPFDEESEL